MKFTKMHGCGNDYIYINALKETIAESRKTELVRKMCDRHYGIGADGVIFICESRIADFEMEMYNADGSRGEMCGNGIRCVAKYVYEKGMTKKCSLQIVSHGCTIPVSLQIENEKVVNVRVNMGSPMLRPEQIPVLECESREAAVNERLEVLGKMYRMTCVSMGNPHAVLLIKDLDEISIEQLGRNIERHPRFPKRTNVEFVQVLSRQCIKMRVWERGSGETLACGTGACAALTACVLNNLTDSQVTVKLLGGQLQIMWDREQNQIYMQGPAETVFEGEFETFNF